MCLILPVVRVDMAVRGFTDITVVRVTRVVR